MNNLKYLLATILLFSSCKSEFHLKGVIVDSVDGSYIPFAKIKTKSFIIESDIEGKFELNCKKGELVSYHALGYNSDTIIIKNRALLVRLIEKDYMKDSIIIKFR